MRQHLISVVLLRRWQKDGEIQYNDCNRGGAGRQRGPKRVAFEENLTGVRSSELEDSWGKLETQMPRVFESFDSEEFMEDESKTGLMRDFVALHFGRSYTTVDMWHQVTERSRVELPEQLRTERNYNYDEMFLDLTGLHAVGPGAHEYVIDHLTEAVVENLRAPNEIAERIEAARLTWLEHSSHWNFEVSHFDEDILVIGDRPVVPYRHSDRRAGFLGDHGLTVESADTVVFPIGPRTLLSFTAGPHQVHRRSRVDLGHYVNRMQIVTCRRYFYSRPGTGLDSELEFINRLTE